MTETNGRGQEVQIGRPRIEIDIEQLKNLVRIQCTAEECAIVLCVDADTINARLKDAGEKTFSEFYKRYAEEGKTSLRRAQWKLALEGNPTMLIWMGKQILGQTDKQAVDWTGTLGIKRTLDDFYRYEAPKLLEGNSAPLLSTNGKPVN